MRHTLTHLIRDSAHHHHGDLLGDIKDYRSVHINGVPASDIKEIKEIIPTVHQISAERGDDCGVWVDPNVRMNYSGKPVIIPVILPEEFGTPSRTVGMVQVYSTAEGWL